MAKMKKAPKKMREMRVVKEALGRAVAKILRDRQITQTEAAYLMKDAPSQVSLVVTGKLAGFSVERLMLMLSALPGASATLTIRNGKIRVAA
jgi:predicted XRE-type DNA-binding protein